MAQTFKNRGLFTAANDIASYSKILSDCYIATDREEVAEKKLREVLEDLQSIAPEILFHPGVLSKLTISPTENGAQIGIYSPQGARVGGIAPA